MCINIAPFWCALLLFLHLTEMLRFSSSWKARWSSARPAVSFIYAMLRWRWGRAQPMSRLPAAFQDLKLWLRSLRCRSSCPLRLANCSKSSKPCHCVVSHQQLSHPSRGWQSSSGWTAKSALQSCRTNDTAAPRGHITPPSHTTLSPRTNVNNRNDCVSCTRARGGNMLILCWPWLRSWGVTTADGNLNELTHKLSIMCLRVSARFRSRTK